MDATLDVRIAGELLQILMDARLHPTPMTAESLEVRPRPGVLAEGPQVMPTCGQV